MTSSEIRKGFLRFFEERGHRIVPSAPVIPHGDPDYSPAHRPTLYVPYAAPYDLNGFASLHPALASLRGPFNAGELAVVHRVGYPNSSRSHFDGSRIWETGNPAHPELFEGWLYRYIHDNALSAGVNLPALSIQGTTPTLLLGDEFASSFFHRCRSR